MEAEPPENRGLAALMVTSGAGGLILLLAGSADRSLILALVAFACFIVSVALLGLSSVLRQHELWRVWSDRQRLNDEKADEDAADG
ncbi:hypothetical protein ABZ744_21070 [Micromonospora chersina]|uniref:hypothetical protein n=1 Tax=Micromonospora chersina TaxID=47854 RepID=UPI00340B314A